MSYMSKNHKIYYVILSIIFALNLGGCSVISINEQTNKVANMAFISGKVIVEEDEKFIVVAIMKSNGDQVEVVNQSYLDGNSEYRMYLLPGKYFISV